jgi:CRP-like cAMP-binding protein
MKSAKASNECATATLEESKPNVVEREYIENALSNDLLFATMRPRVRLEITECFVKYILKTGDVVYAEGHLGENYFLVGSGKLAMTAGGRSIKTLKKGEVFGEVALFDNAPRSCTVTAAQPSVLWALSADVFRETL